MKYLLIALLCIASFSSFAQLPPEKVIEEIKAAKEFDEIAKIDSEIIKNFHKELVELYRQGDDLKAYKKELTELFKWYLERSTGGVNDSQEGDALANYDLRVLSYLGELMRDGMTEKQLNKNFTKSKPKGELNVSLQVFAKALKIDSTGKKAVLSARIYEQLKKMYS